MNAAFEGLNFACCNIELTSNENAIQSWQLCLIIKTGKSRFLSPCVVCLTLRFVVSWMMTLLTSTVSER